MCESRTVFQCALLDPEKERREEKRESVVLPKERHHFIQWCLAIAPGLELIGARLTFQWDIMTRSAPHIPGSVTLEEPFPRRTGSDYLVLV